MTKPLLQFEVSPEELQVLLEVAQIYYLRGEHPKAQKVLEGALVLSPEHGDLLAALGATFHVQGMHDEALDCYNRALKVCPSESCSKANRGELLLLAGEREEAITELKASIEAVGDGNALSDRAKALLRVAEIAEQQAAQPSAE